MKIFPVLLSFCIIGVGLIIEFVFYYLSSFEKHFYYSVQLTSKTLKLFLFRFLSTGLILVVSNVTINLKKDSSGDFILARLVNGQFNDLGTLWFKNVGSALVLTMIISAFSTPMMNFTSVVLKKI